MICWKIFINLIVLFLVSLLTKDEKLDRICYSAVILYLQTKHTKFYRDYISLQQKIFLYFELDKIFLIRMVHLDTSIAHSHSQWSMLRVSSLDQLISYLLLF